MVRVLALTISHGLVLAVGFALGVYFLPILTAPPSPDAAMLSRNAKTALFEATFAEDLSGNDFLHWGKGRVSVGAEMIVHRGELAPGPDYKLYLVKQFVENEEQFERAKAEAVRLGDIKTFNGFLVDVPDGIDVRDFTTVLIWCEAFGEFIAAAKYR
ncbi:MAG: DM13 domain-containing protein [Pseudomonadota bacterium]